MKIETGQVRDNRLFLIERPSLDRVIVALAERSHEPNPL